MCRIQPLGGTGQQPVKVSSDQSMKHMREIIRLQNAYEWPLSHSLQDPEKPGGD
jgi:hypothetical protein